MPVSITCSACAVRLTIPDSLYEQMVRGRSVTIGCKRCGAQTVLDDTKAQLADAELGASGPAEPSQRPSANPEDMDEGPTLVYPSRPPWSELPEPTDELQPAAQGEAVSPTSDETED